ncbi:MAG TPA: zinc ribbon domain-containing protein [Blastocatellia bacterium]|nr:zinc ribbon domain-containing protein [Blastocatellia bacterium]
MFCPRCGNQPASDRVRFCPSCGFRLDGVADLLARDGVPANLLNVPHTSSLQSVEPSERKRGIRRGAKMVFFSLAMFLPVFGFCFVVDGPEPLILPGSLFLAGIFWMIYYRLFGDENAPAPKPVQPPYFGPPPQNASLPPPQSVPVYRSPVETPKEHSVVEHTTRSLERQ